MSYPAKAVANYFIKKAIKEDDPRLNLMKLVKLIYIAHGCYLALYDKPLINEEVQAWTWGPVINNIYHAFKHFGMDLIRETTKEVKTNSKGRFYLENYNAKFPDQIKDVLDKVWNSYKKNSGFDLSRWSHQENSPWDIIWNKNGGKDYYNSPIDNNLIREYFLIQGRENAKRNGQSTAA